MKAHFKVNTPACCPRARINNQSCPEKKIFVTIILLFTFLIPASFGQNLFIKGGLNIAEIYEEERDFINEYNVLPGLNFGMSINLPIRQSFRFESGLLITGKGYKIKGEDYLWMDNNSNYTASTYYLDIPVAIKKVNKISSNTNQYFLFGAYIGIGISGETKLSSSKSGHNETELTKIIWGEDLNRLDAGARIGIGWEFGNILTELSYEFGLLNIVPDTYENYKLKNMVLSISTGIKLW